MRGPPFCLLTTGGYMKNQVLLYHVKFLALAPNGEIFHQLFFQIAVQLGFGNASVKKLWWFWSPEKVLEIA